MTNWLGVDVCLAEFVSDSNGLVNGLVTRSDKRTCRQEVGVRRASSKLAACAWIGSVDAAGME